MPKTKFQEFIYGVIMTFFMVIAMELYNAGLRAGELTYSAFPTALWEMRIMFPKRSSSPCHHSPGMHHRLLHVSHYELLGNINL